MAAAATAGTSAGGATTGDVTWRFDFSTSDFATIVTTTAYVDKSLMIRDVYNASSRIVITAPPRFGKSTNLDMVKRFFEIEADARGIPKPVHTTNNYKLFKDYNLEICKDIVFCNEHFGKYPVVHIDFKPLGGVDDSSKIFNAFKFIIEKSFNQHSYILLHSLTEQVFSGITRFSSTNFRPYFGITEEMVMLENCFKDLSTILNSFFGKKVFVLIDSYDAFFDSPLFKNWIDISRMQSFVESSIGRLLNNVNCIDRVLLTGVIPLAGGFLSINRKFYHFLDDHPFTKYYGLTSAEVDTVLSKVIQCDEERRNVKNTINNYYNAYETHNLPDKIRVHNVWSVLQYIRQREVKSYICDRRVINKFKECFKNRYIRERLQKLLLGNKSQLDISQPLWMDDVARVSGMINSCRAQYWGIEVELIFLLFHHLGYFSVIDDLNKSVVYVNILSEEIKYELGKAVFDENTEFYSSSYMNDILSTLDAFRPDSADIEQNCETLRRNISNWYKHMTIQFTEFTEILFVNLVASGKYSQVMGRTPRLLGPSTVVLLKNRHKVAICITFDSESANIMYWKVTDGAGGEEHIFDVFNDVRGKVIIVADYGFNEFSYSYYFKTGDNLLASRTLPNIRTQ